MTLEKKYEDAIQIIRKYLTEKKIDEKKLDQSIMLLVECNDNVPLIELFKTFKIIDDDPPLCDKEKCNKYGQPMAWKSRPNIIDEWSWRCTTCCSYKTIRKSGFISAFNISLASILKLMYNWVMRYLTVDTKHTVGVSRPTITTMNQHLRTVAVKSYLPENIVLGGPGIVVEIDESLFIKVKHNRGKDVFRPQVWVFGLYERDDSRKNIVI